MEKNLLDIAREISLSGGNLSSGERYSLSRNSRSEGNWDCPDERYFASNDNCDCYEGDCSDCYCVDCNEGSD